MRLKALAYGSSPLTQPQPYSIMAPPWKLPFNSSPTKPSSQTLNVSSSDISKRMFNTQHEFWWGHSDPRGPSAPDKRVGRTMGLGLSDPAREKLGEPGRKGKTPRLLCFLWGVTPQGLRRPQTLWTRISVYVRFLPRYIRKHFLLFFMASL